MRLRPESAIERRFLSSVQALCSRFEPVLELPGMPSPSLLLVAPDADVLVDRVLQTAPGLDLTAASSDTAARAYLGATAFDAVIVSASLDDAADALAALAESLGRPTRLLRGAPSDGLAAWLDARVGGSAPVADAEQTNDLLDEVGAELSRIAHALNNPLAVIDGNAQLGLELARALGTDDSVVAAIEDIQRGSRELASLFAEIAGLRARIEQATGR